VEWGSQSLATLPGPSVNPIEHEGCQV
jgi:hypothetical protein